MSDFTGTQDQGLATIRARTKGSEQDFPTDWSLSVRLGAGYVYHGVLSRCETLLGGTEIPSVDVLLTDPLVAGGCLAVAVTGQPGAAKLFLSNRTPAVPLLHEGGAVGQIEIQPGAEFQFGEYRLIFERSVEVVAYLEGRSDTVWQRLWPIRKGQNRIGRPGKRFNEVPIYDATISREHAELWAKDEGNFELACQSSVGLTSVNNVELQAGQCHQVDWDDILQLGDFLFRIRPPATLVGSPVETSAVPKLTIRSMGSFDVQLGEESLTQKAQKNQLSYELLSRLAATGGKSVPVDKLFEEYWPEQPLEKARRNLNWHVCVLRSYFQSSDPSFDYIVRTGSTIGLNQELLAWHDVSELQTLFTALRRCEAPPLADLERLLELFVGPYLPATDREWADEIRRDLERQFFETLERWGPWLNEHQHFGALLQLAQRVLTFDPTHQLGYLFAMQAFIGKKLASEAVKTYQSCRKLLQRELGVEPSIEIEREFQRAKMLA